VYQISMDAIIPDPSKSINEGGISPLGEERDSYFFRQVQALAKKNRFSLDTAVKDMSKRSLNLILYGNETGPVEIDLDFDEAAASGEIYTTEYEGLVNQLKRWFAGGNSSDSLREWVERFM